MLIDRDELIKKVEGMLAEESLNIFPLGRYVRKGRFHKECFDGTLRIILTYLRREDKPSNN